MVGRREDYPPDKGCQYSPSCLDCPFPDCIIDDHAKMKREIRDEQIRQLFAAGENLETLAKRFRLSERVLRRILERKDKGEKG